jgi:hypothetical protein
LICTFNCPKIDYAFPADAIDTACDGHQIWPERVSGLQPLRWFCCLLALRHAAQVTTGRGETPLVVSPWTSLGTEDYQTGPGASIPMLAVTNYQRPFAARSTAGFVLLVTNASRNPSFDCKILRSASASWRVCTFPTRTRYHVCPLMLASTIKAS